MKDQQISAACVWAYGMWVGAFAIWGVSWAVDLPEVRCLSIIAAVAAATATIRSYFIDQYQRLKAMQTRTTVTAVIDPSGVTPLIRR